MRFTTAALFSLLSCVYPPYFAASSISIPVVNLTYGSFQGSTSGKITAFLGIPYAAPPLGQLRFAPPQPPITFSGVRNATSFGAACIQQDASIQVLPALTLTVPFPPLANVSEDCLFVNVIKPATIPTGKKLPVLFWIYGGGFEIGDTSFNPGNTVVERSIALGEPVIYVSANYRLNAFGFLASREVLANRSTNAGFRDQRFALEWVHDFIDSFGGDPEKVIIWGESAGAISVGLHMLVNDGIASGLFRGAFMDSGSPTSLVRTIGEGQPFYDGLVIATGCSGSTDSLACLREVPADAILAFVNTTPNVLSFRSINLVWTPRIDGDIIARNPVDSLLHGKFAQVPFLTGDCDDEGSVFSLGQLNISTNHQFLQFIHENYLQGANLAEVLAAGKAYPEDPIIGSPFGTGIANTVTLQFKRLAAFQGDVFFQGPRRLFLETAARTKGVNTYSFLYKRGKATPIYGAFHSSDVPEFYGSANPLAPPDDTGPDFIGTDALVNFANTLNPMLPPNPASLLTTSGIDWKSWASSPLHPALTFLDPAPRIAITPDSFRLPEIALLNRIAVDIAGRNGEIANVEGNGDQRKFAGGL